MMLVRTSSSIRRTLLSLHRLMSQHSRSASSTSPDLYSTMKRLIDAGRCQEALDLFDRKSQIPNDSMIRLALKASTMLRDYDRGIRIHREFSKQSMRNHHIQTALIHFYMQCKDIINAEKVFSSVENKTVFMYGALFKGYISQGQPEKVLEVFKSISIKPDEVIVILLFNACARSVHAQSMTLGRKVLRELPQHFRRHENLCNTAMDMLMKFGDVKEAEDLFASMKSRSLVTYGAMMQGYIDNGTPGKALDLFEKLPEAPNDVLHTIVFTACAELRSDRAMKFANQLRRTMPTPFKHDPTVISSMLNMLMKFGQIEEAENVFRNSKKNFVFYGPMMQGYLDQNMPEKVLDLFDQISSKPNDILYIITLGACAMLRNERAIRLGNKLMQEMPTMYKENIAVMSSLIHMLMKFGQVRDAERVFQRMQQRDTHLYAIMMHGYNHNYQPKTCLNVFKPMKAENLAPNDVVFLALIAAASQIGLVSICESIVLQIPQQFRNHLKIQNALIDMWGKALAVNQAEKVFESITQPDAFTYNSMLNAYGRSGMGLEAVDLYSTMPKTMRDSISHICVLNACSHAGLIHAAQTIYQQIPLKTEKIVTAMVDCLSRMSMFDQAQQLINDYEQNHPPSLIMHMALLSAARTFRHSSLAQTLYNRMQSLFNQDPSHLISASILLSNTYASIGDRHQVTDIGDHRLKHYGKTIKAGITWTVVKGELWEFKAHDTSHPRSVEIYAKLDEILMKMKEYEYEADQSWVTRPLDNDETPESALCGHSERLAIAFNLIQDPQPVLIELTNNLRICGDCHKASKLIAKIYQCEIVARDANRGHHFYPNGQCSCLDHF